MEKMDMNFSCIRETRYNLENPFFSFSLFFFMESKNEMLVNTKQFEKYVNRIEHGGGEGKGGRRRKIICLKISYFTRFISLTLSNLWW